MEKHKDENKPYALTSVLHLFRSGSIIYLFISKPNWYDLEDKDGNKIKIPPTWYCGSGVDSDRITDHLIKNKKLTDGQFRVSQILRYMKENNLKMEDNYYFDIYILDFTDFFWHFSRVESGFWLNRQNLIIYKSVLENYVKTHMRCFFADGEPPLRNFTPLNQPIANGNLVIDRFADIWGNTGDCYLQYSIEDIHGLKKGKKKEKTIILFMRKLYYSNMRNIIENALTPITLKELQERECKRSEKRREEIDFSEINYKKLLEP